MAMPISLYYKRKMDAVLHDRIATFYESEDYGSCKKRMWELVVEDVKMKFLMIVFLTFLMNQGWLCRNSVFFNTLILFVSVVDVGLSIYSINLVYEQGKKVVSLYFKAVKGDIEMGESVDDGETFSSKVIQGGSVGFLVKTIWYDIFLLMATCGTSKVFTILLFGFPSEDPVVCLAFFRQH